MKTKKTSIKKPKQNTVNVRFKKENKNKILIKSIKKGFKSMEKYVMSLVELDKCQG